MTETPGQIADQIRACILSGEYAVGKLIPSVRGLTTRFGGAPVTVRLAVAALAFEGLVENRGERKRARVLPLRKVPAPRMVAEELDIEQAEEVNIHTTKSSVVFTRIQD